MPSTTEVPKSRLNISPLLPHLWSNLKTFIFVPSLRPCRSVVDCTIEENQDEVHATLLFLLGQTVGVRLGIRSKQIDGINNQPAYVSGLFSKLIEDEWKDQTSVRQ